MNDREMRELLQEIIDDVDQGRVEVERPRTLRLAGTVLAAAAALGLGLAACSGPAKRDAKDPADSRPRAAQVDAGTKPKPAPPPDMRVMRHDGPMPAYGVPHPSMNVRPKPRKKPMKDNGSVSAYVAPEVR